MAESSLLAALLANESGGKNINNTTQGTSSGQAQGYFQITTGTWDEFGGRQFASNPQAASYAQQAEIASKIPLSRWDPTTIDRMRKTGLAVNPHQTLGQNLTNAGESFADYNPKDGGLPVGKGTGVIREAGAVSGAPVPTTPAPAPPTIGEMLGQAFASVGAATAPSAPFQDPEDVPNAPSVAAQTNFAPRDAVPASATASASARPVSGILAGLAAQNPSQPQDAANFLNAGAPSMTGLLLNPSVATNFSDPRRTAGPNPFAAPTPRLA